LPILKKNKYNYIYFAINNVELEKINVNPKPDASIRILMEYKGLDRNINVNKEKLNKIDRKGFTLVEWGGTEIK